MNCTERMDLLDFCPHTANEYLLSSRIEELESALEAVTKLTALVDDSGRSVDTATLAEDLRMIGGSLAKVRAMVKKLSDSWFEGEWSGDGMPNPDNDLLSWICVELQTLEDADDEGDSDWSTVAYVLGAAERSVRNGERAQEILDKLHG